jgi:hypothetical protein
MMLIPLLLWAFTGAIFLFKPGYDSAYEQLSPKLYPIDNTFHFNGRSEWSQIRLMKTVLGSHLLVLEGDHWKHLNPSTLKAKQKPTTDEVRALVADALRGLSDRYGTISDIEGSTVFTDTGVVVTLDWATLSLQQKGPDTFLIDTLYQIHYLQWFSSPVQNRALGVLGLISLVALSVLGISLLIRDKHDKST